MSDATSVSRVLVVTAHPDDEALGAGGTLARHAAQGHEVHIAFMTDGVGARDHDRAAIERRAVAARRVAGLLGAGEPRFLGFPDNRLDTVGLLDVVKAVEAVVAELKPDTIYTHHCGDLNIDHAVCHRAVMTACRPLPGSTVRRILAMEVVSSTEWPPDPAAAFVPNRFVDIAATRETKHRLIEIYGEEMRPLPHPRSLENIDALARLRGASAGLQWAEAFLVLRDIVTGPGGMGS